MLGADSPQQETIQSVELSYQTRGTQKFLHITSESIEVRINGKITHYETTENQWQKILKTFQKVKLSQVAKLKRPSKKSFYDGALISQVKAVTNLKEYESANFDHDAPPTALIKPINAMKLTLIGTDNKSDF